MKDFFEYKNGKIYYEMVGKGQPLTFIHGFSLDQRMWRDQVSVFSTRFKVITYDMRGYGKSSIPKEKHSHHDDLLALLDYLKISKTHLVGLSLGGEVALDFTVSYPDRLLSLTLADSSLRDFPCSVNWNVKAEKVGIKQAKINWLDHQIFKETKKNKNVFKKLKLIIDDYSGWQWLNSVSKDKVTPAPIDQLDKITCPVLIVVGENDLEYYHDTAKFLEKNIKSSKRVIIKKSGHMINMEKPVEFNQMLMDFLVTKL